MALAMPKPNDLGRQIGHVMTGPGCCALNVFRQKDELVGIKMSSQLGRLVCVRMRG